MARTSPAAALDTFDTCALSITAPDTAFHTRAVASRATVRILVPSGLHAARSTGCGVVSFPSGSPVTASHTRAVPSYEPVTIRAPSGLHAAEKTKLSWPESVA